VLKGQDIEKTIEFQSTIIFLDGHLNINQQHHDPNDSREIAPATMTRTSDLSGNGSLCF